MNNTEPTVPLHNLDARLIEMLVSGDGWRRDDEPCCSCGPDADRAFTAALSRDSVREMIRVN